MMLGPAAGGHPKDTFWLRPQCNLERRQLGWLVGALAAVTMATACWSAGGGNVFAPLFAAVEMLAVGSALYLAWHGCKKGERIRLDADAIVVTTWPGRRCRAEYPSYWVRVVLEPGVGRQRLLLRAYGRETEIGAFLAEPERQRLARELRAKLAQFQRQ